VRIGAFPCRPAGRVSATAARDRCSGPSEIRRVGRVARQSPVGRRGGRPQVTPIGHGRCRGTRRPTQPDGLLAASSAGSLGQCPSSSGADLQTRVLESFPDVRVEVVWTVAEGDKVVTWQRMRGTHLGPWIFAPAPTGRRVETDVVVAFELTTRARSWTSGSGRISLPCSNSWVRMSGPRLKDHELVAAPVGRRPWGATPGPNAPQSQTARLRHNRCAR
jgi:hypothetical protein